MIRYVDKCGSKNGHQKLDIGYKEIGLHTQNILTILGSIVNMIGRGAIHENLRFDNEYDVPCFFDLENDTNVRSA